MKEYKRRKRKGMFFSELPVNNDDNPATTCEKEQSNIPFPLGKKGGNCQINYITNPSNKKKKKRKRKR